MKIKYVEIGRKVKSVLMNTVFMSYIKFYLHNWKLNEFWVLGRFKRTSNTPLESSLTEISFENSENAFVQKERILIIGNLNDSWNSRNSNWQIDMRNFSNYINI